MSNVRNVGILLFDDVEILDFCGPYEVFSVANRECQEPSMNVFTIAEANTTSARYGLSINPNYSLANNPKVDILLVPGGIGSRREINNRPLVRWILETANDAELVLSVCTGALLLGKAGLIDGLEVTTHHLAYDLLREVAPSSTVLEDKRYIDNGRVVTSAGIAAGIDMSLHVVARLLGNEVATATACRMEYPWEPSDR